MASSQLVVSAFLLVLASCLFTSAVAYKVWLFRDSEFRGGHIELSGSGCKGVPSDFNDRTSSVNTHGGCVILYQNSGCTGQSVQVFPGSGAHNNLKKLGFNDRTSSVGNWP
uniref:Beta/gamma crystallin 'Greek key' domain-containing protein n=1 Tax=Cacopsylla melanoneura TaxID=428564 RepID=A0A8D8XBK1_9HEMI